MAVIGNAPQFGNITIANDAFNGDASTTVFTLSQNVGATTDIEVIVDNVQQSPYDGSYSVAGTLLIFSAAPAAGTNNIYVIYNVARTTTTLQVIPDDGSVTTAKIYDGSVTNSKLASTYLETAAGLITGSVRAPNQPFFYAKNASESGDGITTSPPVFTNVIKNIGNHFVTSGVGAYSRFFAPVAGTYFFSGNPGYKQSGQSLIVRLSINDVNITDVIRLIGTYPDSHSGLSFCVFLYLNANDYVNLDMQGSTYHRNSSSVPNWFSGGLLY